MQPMLNHVAWVVQNEEAAIAFLETYFSCKAGETMTLQGAWADELAQIKGVKVSFTPMSSPGTATHIAVLKFEHPPSATNDSVAKLYVEGFRHIGFLVEDIDSSVARLKSDGYRFLSDVVTVPGLTESRTVYLSGPESVVVQLTELVGSMPPPKGS
jgi:catechol 2,3-dioxygenase-like lactoylglutathione lyase family enzyme